MPGWQAAMKSWSLQEMADCHRNKRPEACCVKGGLEGVGCISKKVRTPEHCPGRGVGWRGQEEGWKEAQGERGWLCSPADGGHGFQGVSMSQDLSNYT